ncbi:hypothetical protein D9M68_775320 [compost metagenome]
MPYASLQLVDHLANFLGGLLSARSQGAHLIRDHGEASPGVSSTCGLDGGIECEQVGLIGDAGDDRKNRLDALAEGGQLVDGLAGVFHFLGQALNGSGRPADQRRPAGGFIIGGYRGLGSVLSITCNVFGCGSHFLHGRGQLVQLL